jgi:hypothetical protein
MDIESNTRKATAREVQRQLFIGSLHREMDRMETRAATRNAGLAQKASEYLADGCSLDEVVELLILDGYPSDLARSQVGAELSVRCASLEAEEEETLWDFTFEDARGHLYTGSQFGLAVTADSKESAMQKAGALLEEEGSDSKETVIDAEPLAN